MNASYLVDATARAAADSAQADATQALNNASTAVAAANDAADAAAAAQATADAASVLKSTIQAANQVVTNDTTFTDSVDCSIALQPGTYLCESYEVVLNSSTTGLSKSRVNFTGTASSAQALIRRIFSTTTDASNLGPLFYAQSGGSVQYNTQQTNFGSNRSMIIHRRFPLVVTVAGTLSIQFAMSVASGGGDTATLLPSSFLTVFKQ